MRKPAIYSMFFYKVILTITLVCGLSAHTFAQKNKISPADTTKQIAEKDTTKNKSKKSQDITDTIHYESDQIDYNADEKILTLIGKSIVQYQNITLTADTIIYNINQNSFTASGLPQLIEGKDTTIGDIMVYNIKTRRGRVQYASTHLDDGYFNGQRIVKTNKDELYVDEGDYTTCSVVDTPHFYFYGKNIKVIPKDKIISRPVVLNIGDAPVAYLPYFIFPIERNRRSGLLTPSWGGHPNNGGYIDNIGYYYAPNDYLDFLIRGKVSDFREFVLEGSSRYAIKYLLNGSINARTAITSDFGQSSNQWAIDYNHFQNITPDGMTTLSGRGSIVSQKNFYERFSEDSSELTNQTLNANLSLSHRFDKINASTSITWNRDHNLATDNISEDLPSFNFNLPNRPFIPVKDGAIDDSAARWYNKIYYDYATHGLIRHTTTNDGMKRDTYYPGLSQSVNLSSPQKIFKWFTINPSLSAHMSTFNGYIDTVTKRIDTLYDTVQYTLLPPFHDTRYTSGYETVRLDTLSRDNYGRADSISIIKRKQRINVVHDTTKNQFSNVTWWNADLKLSTNVYGTFPIHILNFVGLRHTFTPTLQYSFVPKSDLNKEFYNIGIDYDKGHKQKQIMSINLHNQFDGKLEKKNKGDDKPTEVKFPLLSVDLSTSYDFEADSNRFSNLNLSASTGFNALRVNYTSSFWMQDQHDNLTIPIMNSMSIDLSTGAIGAHGSFWGGDLLELDSLQYKRDTHGTNVGAQKWDFSFTPSYSYSLTRSKPTEMFTPEKKYSLGASANINFTPNWSLSWSANYNFTDNQWVQNSINLHCDMECWEMKFQWRPEKLNPGYYFVINIKKIPEIKWEQKE